VIWSGRDQVNRPIRSAWRPEPAREAVELLRRHRARRGHLRRRSIPGQPGRPRRPGTRRSGPHLPALCPFAAWAGHRHPGQGVSKKEDDRYSTDPANLAHVGLLDAMRVVMRGAAQLLRPDGIVAMTVRPWRSAGGSGAAGEAFEGEAPGDTVHPAVIVGIARAVGCPRAPGSPSSPNSGPIGAAARRGAGGWPSVPSAITSPVTDRHQHGPRLRPMIAPDWSVPGGGRPGQLGVTSLVS
jgi:hypothetical protein